MDRRRFVIGTAGLAVGASFFGRAQAQEGTLVPAASPVPAGTDWPLPGGNLAGTRATPSSIDSVNASSLSPAWATDIGGTVAGTPVVSNGSVFVVTWDGKVVSLDLASGAPNWTAELGASVADPKFGGTIGAADGAAVDGGTVYAGDAAGMLHALDSATGDSIWAVKVDTQEGAAILAAPIVWDGLVFAPVTTTGDDPAFRGSLVAVSAADGTVAWQRFFAVENGQGGLASSTPAIDAETGQLFLSVSASNSAPPALFALEAKTGEVIWQSTIDLPLDALADLPAPTAAVNCFTVSIDGKQRAVVGAGFPDGIYRLFDRADGTLIWERSVAFGGPFGGMLGAAAIGDGAVLAPATNWQAIDAPASGVVMAIDIDTGDFGWMSITAAPAIAPVSVSNDVVFYGGLDGIVRVDAIADGAHLWSVQLEESIGSGIAVLDRTIVFGTGAPAVGDFVKPGTSVLAYALTTEGTPVPSAAGEPEASPTAASTETPTPAAAVFESSMQSLKFVPEEIDIPAGTTVVWSNDDVVAHTVTHRVAVEDQLFASPYISPGESFSYTFDTPGTYPIYCLPHPFMVQTVVVS